MTRQYATEDINYSPASAFVFSRTLNATQQGATDTAVFRFDLLTVRTTNDFTVATTAAAGTTITIIKPGTYIATLIQSINGANTAIGISLGGTNAPFTTTPAAIGGDDGIIALKVSVANDASVLNVCTSFRISEANINGTANVLRFMGNAGGVFVATTVTAQVQRVGAA